MKQQARGEVTVGRSNSRVKQWRNCPRSELPISPTTPPDYAAPSAPAQQLGQRARQALSDMRAIKKRDRIARAAIKKRDRVARNPWGQLRSEIAAPLTLLRPGSNRATRKKGQFSCGAPLEKRCIVAAREVSSEVHRRRGDRRTGFGAGYRDGRSEGAGEQEGMHEARETPLQKQTAVITRGTKGGGP